jgi:hypothetical protein
MAYRIRYATDRSYQDWLSGIASSCASLLKEYRLKNLQASIIIPGMAIKITAEIKKLLRKQFASSGGTARAKKYSSEQLSEWAKKGGRPRKGAKAKAEKDTPSLGKGRQK